jgi:hypothetical protein
MTQPAAVAAAATLNNDGVADKKALTEAAGPWVSRWKRGRSAKRIVKFI